MGEFGDRISETSECGSLSKTIPHVLDYAKTSREGSNANGPCKRLGGIWVRSEPRENLQKPSDFPPADRTRDPRLV